MSPRSDIRWWAVGGPGGPAPSLVRMSQLDRPALRKLMAEVMQKQDKTLPDDDAADLREIGFRSLDFSELALRVEDELDAELNFEAAELRQIETIGDVLALLEDLQADLAS